MKLIKNNDGMTLIELIISMAITAIVLTIIVLIINTASKSFKHTNEDVNLQLEAQIAMNQLSTITMESSDITDVSVGISPDVKFLLTGSTECYAIYYKADKRKLYLIPAATTAEADAINPVASTDTEYEYLMAEYITGFKIKHVVGDKSAKINIDFALGDSEYSTSKKVMLRNAN